VRNSVRSTAAAVGFGLLTWSVAHLTTLAAFAHIHPGFVVHYHGWVGPLAVAAIMLTVTSIVGAGSAILRPPANDPRIAVLNGALAPAVFVAVEFAEYLAGAHEAPPAALLVIGCLVHAAIGATAPALWKACTGGARLSTAAPFHAIRRAATAAVRPVARVWAVADTYHHQGSRAPPRRRVPVPAAC
jgi:hypothetical protein